MLGNQNGGAFLRFLLVLALGAAVAFAGLAAFRAGAPPSVEIAPATKGIGKRTPVKITARAPGRGLSAVRVELVQGGRAHLLVDKTYVPRPAYAFWGPRTSEDVLSLTVGRDVVKGLKQGQATVRVTAGRPGSWLRSPDPVVRELEMPVRLTPPSLSPLSNAVYVSQGGSEVVVYQVGETAVKHGVRAGEAWFPGHPLPGGGLRDRFALFAVPFDVSDPARVRLIAVDEVGNEATASFVHQFFPQSWHRSRIELDDAFLAKVVPEILSQSPDVEEASTPIETYLVINRDLRRANNAELKALADRSEPRFLWSRPFLRMMSSQEAGFADHRTYAYQGRPVDEQVHLGEDMADRRGVAVPAANDGVVALAKYFGIYGNTVVLDHGYGLMTLYGHLSSIGVKEGDRVARGDSLGLTGETGLAGGDHLHYSVLIDGVFVRPKEWWDGHWIQDRIALKLGKAFPFKP